MLMYTIEVLRDDGSFQGGIVGPLPNKEDLLLYFNPSEELKGRTLRVIEHDMSTGACRSKMECEWEPNLSWASCKWRPVSHPDVPLDLGSSSTLLSIQLEGAGIDDELVEDWQLDLHAIKRLSRRGFLPNGYEPFAKNMLRKKILDELAKVTKNTREER